MLFALAGGGQWVADFAAVRTVEDPFVYLVYNLFIGVPITLWVAATRRRNLTRVVSEQWRGIAAGSVFDIVGYGLVLYVAHSVRVAEVLPVANLRIAFVAMLGVLVLKERPAGRRLAAAAVLVAGAMVASLA